MSYDQSARLGVYDAIYTHMKNYPQEAAQLVELIRNYGQTSSRSVLVVAAGTGLYEHTLLELGYTDITGLDQSPHMLALARRRNPGITYHEADMRDFDLRRQYAVVTNLFSAIGHIGPNDSYPCPPHRAGRSDHYRARAHATHVAAGSP